MNEAFVVRLGKLYKSSSVYFSVLCCYLFVFLVLELFILSNSTIMSIGVQDSPHATIYESQPRQHENQSSSSSESSSQIDDEKWNHPRSNIAKTLATFWSFLIMGANDSAYGVRSHLDIYPWQFETYTNRIQRSSHSSHTYINPYASNSPPPSNTFPARILLQPLLHNRLPRLPVSTTRLCHRRNRE